MLRLFLIYGGSGASDGDSDDCNDFSETSSTNVNDRKGDGGYEYDADAIGDDGVGDNNNNYGNVDA